MASYCENKRRDYWTGIMNEADLFVSGISQYPVEECGERAVSIEEAALSAGVEIEFSELPHVNGLPRLYLIREGLVKGLLGAAREMNNRGWKLKVEDGYRTREMQRIGLQKKIFSPIFDMVRRECGGDDPPLELLRRRFTALVAPSPKVGTHMSASAVDVSVLVKGSGEELDRGAFYPEMSELTPMLSPFIPAKAATNRKTITKIMNTHGFAAYPFEFWHYSAGDAFAECITKSGKPARYGPVDLDRYGAAVPIENPLGLIFSDDDFSRLMIECCGGS